jgi:hypothetical protein
LKSETDENSVAENYSKETKDFWAHLSNENERKKAENFGTRNDKGLKQKRMAAQGMGRWYT